MQHQMQSTWAGRRGTDSAAEALRVLATIRMQLVFGIGQHKRARAVAGAAADSGAAAATATSVDGVGAGLPSRTSTGGHECQAGIRISHMQGLGAAKWPTAGPAATALLAATALPGVRGPTTSHKAAVVALLMTGCVAGKPLQWRELIEGANVTSAAEVRAAAADPTAADVATGVCQQSAGTAAQRAEGPATHRIAAQVRVVTNASFSATAQPCGTPYYAGLTLTTWSCRRKLGCRDWRCCCSPCNSD